MSHPFAEILGRRGACSWPQLTLSDGDKVPRSWKIENGNGSGLAAIESMCGSGLTAKSGT